LDDDHLIALLLEARRVNIAVWGEGDDLRVRSPHEQEHPLIAQLREHKPDISAFLGGLDERIRRGQRWLVVAEQRLTSSGRPDDQQVETMLRNLDQWDNLDSLVEPRHCPIGSTGCDPDSPVLCRSCGR